MFRIGAFARIGRVSVKTLRHYDAIGLLRPHAVDGSSSYRYYQPRQLRRLHRILDLKGMGFSLEVVRDMVDEELDVPALRENLRIRRQELSSSISLQREQLADVDARLKALERGRARRHPEVLVAKTKPRRVVSLRSPLSSYAEADALFRDLERRVATVDRDGSLGAIWHGCGRDGAIDCEAFVPVRDDLPAPRGLSTTLLPAATMVSVFHYGSDETHGRTYALAREWIAARGRRVSGPNHELYLSKSHAPDAPGGPDEPDGDDDITEIRFPLEDVERQ
jgi:DNA-binding transcriptional MerR regulator